MQTFNVDRSHGGIRFAVLVAFAVGFVGGILFIPRILRAAGMDSPINGLIILGGAFALGPVLSWGIERLLWQIWPSGRTLRVTESGLTLRERTGEDVTLDFDQRVNVLAWSFPIESRRSWVPRGWYCLAIRLGQGREYIAPYTFVNPKDLPDLPGATAFAELISHKEAHKAGNEHLLALYADQIHLRAAEDDRWKEGAEMMPNDFAALVRTLDARLPTWPPDPDAGL